MHAGTRFRFVLLVTAGLMAAALTSAPVAAAAAPDCGGKVATIVGTARAELLQGTGGYDVIVGLGGNDTIKGLGGGDRICGGEGNDTLFGGRNDDRLRGDEGNDKLNGGIGDSDLLTGGRGGDALNGGIGVNDFLVGGPGADALDGGPGIRDFVEYEEAPGPVTVDLAAGTAVGVGSDTLANIEGISGSSHDDKLIGNAGPNALYGEHGNDTVSAGPGDDRLYGMGDDDALDGGSGEDLVAFLGPASGITANLTTGTATGEGSDTLANIENIEGSMFDDMLIGDAGPNMFWPFEGNDAIDGSTGTDTVSYEFVQIGVTANLSSGTATSEYEGTDTLAGIENLLGSRFDDALTGAAGSNMLLGLAGDDTLDGGAGTDTLDGGGGTDTCLNGENNSNCELLPAPSGQAFPWWLLALALLPLGVALWASIRVRSKMARQRERSLPTGRSNPIPFMSEIF